MAALPLDATPGLVAGPVAHHSGGRHLGLSSRPCGRPRDLPGHRPHQPRGVRHGNTPVRPQDAAGRRSAVVLPGHRPSPLLRPPGGVGDGRAGRCVRNGPAVQPASASAASCTTSRTERRSWRSPQHGGTRLTWPTASSTPSRTPSARWRTWNGGVSNAAGAVVGVHLADDRQVGHLRPGLVRTMRCLLSQLLSVQVVEEGVADADDEHHLGLSQQVLVWMGNTGTVPGPAAGHRICCWRNLGLVRCPVLVPSGHLPAKRPPHDDGHRRSGRSCPRPRKYYFGRIVGDARRARHSLRYALLKPRQFTSL